MKERKDHGCHANYDVKGYVSIDVAAKILGISQDKARDVLKRKDVRRMDVRVNERGRQLAVYNKEEVIKLNIKRNEAKVGDPLKAAAKRLAANAPKVGFSLRKEKPEGDKTVYQPTYEDFFQWCSQDRAWPKVFFEDYVKLANLDDSCNHEIVKFAIGTAMRECWVSWFDKIKKYLTDIVGTKKTERNEHPVFGCGMIEPGYLDFMRRMAARNAAEKEGGAK